MEDKMKVSVLLATYNQEKYIGHALESVVSQKVNFKYELLVGEDCSTDGTAEVVREYALKYPDIIVPFFREKNLGMFANMPELMMHTRGEYIAFIEGDDYWIDDNKLQKQVDFLDAHPDYVACFGKCIIVDENDERHPEREQYTRFKEAGEYTIKDFEQYFLPGQTATSMYRASVYGDLQKKVMEAGIDVSRVIDRGQVLCMLSVGKMHVLDDEIAAYRHIMDANSGTWSSQNDGYRIEPLLQYLDGMKNMEGMAKALGLSLNFDERRNYELEKLNENPDAFTKEEVEKVKSKIKEGYNSKLKRMKAMMKYKNL